MTDAPSLGFGLGLRAPHALAVLETRPPVGWFEILSDNYLNAHAGYLAYLEDVRAAYPLVMHGVSLSIGSTDPLDAAYVHSLRRLADRLAVGWVSDHLCFTGIDRQYSHDLLPIPYTDEALRHLIPRIQQTQDILQRPLVLENASTYLEFAASVIPEPEFLAELCQRTGCGILLDLNNVYVSSHNHGWDAYAYIDAVPGERIVQYHLAGHSRQDGYLFDTHNTPVSDPVWDLYAYAVRRKGLKSTLIEWDDAIPPLATLLAEAQLAETVAAAAVAAASPQPEPLPA